MSEMLEHARRFKDAHAALLRDGILEMRYSEELTDFKVIVDTVVFNVHRLVLAANSPYFKAMLSHNMKETVEGQVVMKEVTPEAIKACILFMYSGEVDLSEAEMSDVLYAAAFMQLDLFLDFCRDYLEENLGIDSAIYSRRLACAYGFENVESKSRKFIEGNIKDVTSTDQFLGLSVDDVAEYIEILDADKGTIWLGVINWIRHDAIGRTNHLARLLRLYSESNQNLESFITSSWSEEEVKHSKECREIIQERLVTSTPGELALIGKTVCCQLKHILQHCELGDVAAINDALNEILITNFAELSRENEFKFLLYGDVAAGIQESKCSEEVKWEAILNWTRGEKRRTSRFPGLFRLLNFDLMSLNFIQVNLRNEILVRESSESMAILMDVFAAKVQNTRQESGKDDETRTKEDHEAIQIAEENNTEQSFLSGSNSTDLTSINSGQFAAKVENTRHECGRDEAMFDMEAFLALENEIEQAHNIQGQLGDDLSKDPLPPGCYDYFLLEDLLPVHELPPPPSPHGTGQGFGRIGTVSPPSRRETLQVGGGSIAPPRPQLSRETGQGFSPSRLPPPAPTRQPGAKIVAKISSDRHPSRPPSSSKTLFDKLFKMHP